MNVT
jgi:hypothetical protein